MFLIVLSGFLLVLVFFITSGFRLDLTLVKALGAGGGAEEGTAMPLPRPPPSRRVPKNDASFAQVEFPRPAPRDSHSVISSLNTDVRKL